MASDSSTSPRPRLEGLIAALTIAGVAMAALLFSYRYAHSAQIQAVQRELVQLARTAATVVDGDLHRTLEAPEREGSPDHLRALAPLAAFHRATIDIIYVYTAVLRQGAVFFVLDPTRLSRHPLDNLPSDPIMTPYPGSDRALRHALEAQTVDVNEVPVVERMRSYMSAFAPFYDSQGRFVGVVGIDMWVHHLEGRLALLRRTLMLATISTLALAAAFGFVVYRWRLGAALALAHDRRVQRSLTDARDVAERHAREAERDNRAKMTFLATMSHELRTPLNAVIGYAELIEQELRARNDESLTDDLNRVQSAGRHLLCIINNVLDFARIDSGGIALERIEIDPAALLVEVKGLVEADAGRKRITVQTRVGSLPQVMRGDPTRLRQVLLNLIANAIKFSPGGSSVEGRVEFVQTPAPCVRFQVTDQGIGIPADRMEALFKPFSQVDASTTRRFGGTGLGLVISKRLVDLMGGTIRVESRPGAGACFTVEIPSDSASPERPAPG